MNNISILWASPIGAALCLTVFTWLMAALGSGTAFFIKVIPTRFMDMVMGFGAGVMIASSFWSLLLPAIESSRETGGVLLPILGFACGGGFVVLADSFFGLMGFEQRFGNQAAGFRRSAMLVMAMTIHNIPEGMAVGMAVAGASLGLAGTNRTAAIMLAIGIALQNVTEGASVSLPLRREGVSARKSFLYGQLSGLPEPIAAVVGVVMAYSLGGILPFLLAFAAGAMIAVVCGEIIPASASSSKNLSVIGVISGFVLMMILDVTL